MLLTGAAVFPGVKLRSNSNFLENSQVWYQIDQKIILNKDVVFSFALCGQAL